MNNNRKGHYRPRAIKDHSPRVKLDKMSLFNIEVCHLLKWLIEVYAIPISTWDLSQPYIRFLNHLYSEKGLKVSIERIKLDRLRVYQYLSGFKQEKDKSLTYDGLPKKLKTLIPLIREGKPLNLRFISTLLYSLRRFNLPLDPKISSITNESEAQDYSRIFKYTIPFIKKLIRITPKSFREKDDLTGNLLVKFKTPIWEEYHMTAKKGPSKGQGLVNCLQDLVSMPDTLINSISSLGGDLLSKNLTTLLLNVEELSNVLGSPVTEDKTFVRRIASFGDSEGKTRLIALVDYFSQTALKPLHTRVMGVLRCIPQDQTFNQGEGLKELTFDPQRTYHSFDLVAFTDRFAIKICAELLSKMYTMSYARSWLDVMCGYGFAYMPPKGELTDLVFLHYSVGNPMGAYSSWPVTTLSHHFIVYVACRELRIGWSTAEYKLLGDDIIIWNSKLAIKYSELIELIGVDIQMQKSHVGNSLFEFAKRIFIPTGEISPFSIKAGLSETGRFSSFISFFEMLDNHAEKGWILNISRLDAVLRFYSSHPTHFREKSKINREITIKQSYMLYRMRRGYDGELPLINQFLALSDYPQLSCNQVKLAKAIVSAGVYTIYEKSASTLLGKLDYRFERALIQFTTGTDRTDAVYAHPFTFVYGKYVEEMYLLSNAEAEAMLMKGQDWLPEHSTLIAADPSSMFEINSQTSKVVRSESQILKEIRKGTSSLATSSYFSVT